MIAVRRVNLAPMGVLRGKKRHNDDGTRSASDAGDFDHRPHSGVVRLFSFEASAASSRSSGAWQLTSATRMRRLRARRKAGATFVEVLVRAPAAANLVALGWLRANAPASEVRQALLRMVRQAMALGVRPDAW